MDDWKQRTELLLGSGGVATLSRSRVLVVGVGGVGAYAVEMLARAGVGKLDIVDGDNVGVTNVNRQLPALHSTVGQPKVEVMCRRIADINPEAEVKAINCFITEDSVRMLLDGGNYDFVVDAIDSVAPKVALIKHCLASGLRIISSMGAGGRIDASKVRYADLWETYNDGLAKVVRTRLKAEGIRRKLPVVWSEEMPEKAAVMLTDEIANKRSSYGTVSYLPAIFGCMLGAYVIRKLTGK
ncbi:MAG: tRNA threonylcarbamoyladenosine dehydratase [Bacteroidetes bacterium]|uniref:tRNA threonylcarbamoyladenosine dehydratase n=1 Tax=Candidatus Limisoma faecipullorum TaxID=2840854 RepID=A0A9D9IQ99_9BACT|nr:tRNA threonylcarbamoyladenosine dehydratase [Candidatus Limisoma faecipullorum]